MSSVDEIERAIRELSAADFAQIARRVHDLEQERWDSEMDQDAASGRLDFLREEAKAERRAGLLREWPPSS